MKMATPRTQEQIRAVHHFRELRIEELRLNRGTSAMRERKGHQRAGTSWRSLGARMPHLFQRAYRAMFQEVLLP